MIPLMFSGIEVEGIHKGKKTLFIQGRVSYDKIVTALNGSGYEQIYFGAKYKDFSIAPSDVDYETVDKVRRLFPIPICTVELDFTYGTSINNRSEHINYILVCRYINHIFNFINKYKAFLNFNNVQIKLYSGARKSVLLIPANIFKLTREEEYSKDELILV